MYLCVCVCVTNMYWTLNNNNTHRHIFSEVSIVQGLFPMFPPLILLKTDSDGAYRWASLYSRHMGILYGFNRCCIIFAYISVPERHNDSCPFCWIFSRVKNISYILLVVLSSMSFDGKTITIDLILNKYGILYIVQVSI